MGRLLRTLAVLAAALVAGVVAAPPAAAHAVGGGARPTNYRSELVAVSPAVPGVELRLLELGRKVELVNRTDADVVVTGYDGKPWRRVEPGTRQRWQDKRTRWDGPDPPAVRAAPGREQVVGQWVLPLRHGDTAIAATGRITWVPGPSALPWLLLALALAAATFAAGWTRRWGPPLGAALGVLVATDVVHGFAAAAPAVDGPVATAVRVLLGGFLSTAAWAGAAWAVGALQRQNELALFAGGFAALFMALYSAADAIDLGRSQVAYAFPAVAARASVAVTLGLGVGLVGAAVAVFARHPELLRPVDDDG